MGCFSTTSSAVRRSLQQDHQRWHFEGDILGARWHGRSKKAGIRYGCRPLFDGSDPALAAKMNCRESTLLRNRYPSLEHLVSGFVEGLGAERIAVIAILAIL